MIYADPSFLCSLYGRDDNSALAQQTYNGDARRPLWFTPWQRLEVRNALRLAVHRLGRAGLSVPFQLGNVFKRMDEDLSAGRLKYDEPELRDAFRLAEEWSHLHTAAVGCAAVDLWHVANAALLAADTFWTFDAEQFALAKAVGRFKKLPRLIP